MSAPKCTVPTSKKKKKKKPGLIRNNILLVIYSTLAKWVKFRIFTDLIQKKGRISNIFGDNGLWKKYYDFGKNKYFVICSWGNKLSPTTEYFIIHIYVYAHIRTYKIILYITCRS